MSVIVTGGKQQKETGEREKSCFIFLSVAVGDDVAAAANAVAVGDDVTAAAAIVISLLEMMLLLLLLLLLEMM